MTRLFLIFVFFYQLSLSCFNFFLFDYRFLGMAVLLMEILYISKGLEQVGTVFGKSSRNHPFLLFRFLRNALPFLTGLPRT